MDGHDLDAAAGRVVADLLVKSHLTPLGQVTGMLAETARPLGVSAVRIYLADLQQRSLKPLPGGLAMLPEALPIDSTVAGRAYQTVRIHVSPAGDGQDGYRVWVPLIDGTERLGVLELEAAEASEAMLARYRMIASLAGLVVASKGVYSDIYAQLCRSRDMALQAELVWAILAPRTFATEQVLVTATLEPAYDVGGDAFDYSLIGDRLHVSIFDAAGHDLAAGLLASVAMASCRSTRRAGGTLQDIVTRADHAITRQFGNSRFVTALLCDLDVATGQFAWIPCGHPPPLLIRGGKVVKELARPPQLPLGLAELGTLARRRGYAGQPLSGDGWPLADAGQPPDCDSNPPAYTERLEPADRVLLYTDGVTEGRAADGSPFGTERLSDFIIRHTHAGTPAPETLRRLTRAIAEYQHGRISDDATIMMVEWMPDHVRQEVVP